MMFSDLNPKFVFFSPLPAGTADRRQLAEHVDHAIIAMGGRAPHGGDLSIELLAPIIDAAEVRVDLWVAEIGESTCTYGFIVTSEDGRRPYARGERSVVSIDPVSHQPSRWSSEFRAAHTELLKDLPAYA